MSGESEEAILERMAAAGISGGEREARRIRRAIERSPQLSLDDLLGRWATGALLEHLLGTTTFMGVELMIGPGALVPREETDLLGHTAVGLLETMGGAELRVVDMCCGSANLGCAVATHVPRARVWASDLTDDTVAWARRNVSHLGLDTRVEVLQGDLFAPLDALDLAGTIDVVICNPPYISTARLTGGDRQDLLAHEPREAFDGGPYGLSIHQRVIKEAPRFLRPGGHLLFEFGLGQDRQLAALFKRGRVYGEVEFARDADGSPRVARAQMKERVG